MSFDLCVDSKYELKIDKANKSIKGRVAIEYQYKSFLFLKFMGLSAKEELQSTENEALRVIIHGILHCLGYKDANTEQKLKMRKLEDDFIKMFHVKQNSHV